MPTIKTDPIDTIHSIVRMLTQEGRITFDIADPEAARLTIVINTINREYGRLLGSGGQALRDINTIAKAMLPECEVILNPRADDSIDSDDAERVNIEHLLMDVFGHMEELSGSQIQPKADGVAITTDCEDQGLRLAVERIFFNIGRAQRHRFAITWE